jgi:hypothetical protein
MAANLYEIPILRVDDPPRTLMQQVAFDGCPRGFPNLKPAHRIGVQARACLGGAAGAAGSIEMLDIIMLAVGLGFFALSVGYAMACDQL